MGKLRLDIKSTSVLGVYGIVDIVFNGTTIESNKQLSGTNTTLNYDVEILTSTDNSLKVNLLNDQAYDANKDGDFMGDGDETMKVTVNALSYSTDGTNYITLLPQSSVSYTVPSGANAGETVEMRPSVSEFLSFGLNSELKFNGQGLANTAYLQGYHYIEKDGVYYDKNGDIVPN